MRALTDRCRVALFGLSAWVNSASRSIFEGNVMTLYMRGEYRLFCTACSFTLIVDGVDQALEKQTEHEQQTGSLHTVEFKKVNEACELFPDT